MTPAGWLTTLASFNYTNGATPRAALVTGSDGYFYGTATSGGGGYGTVFRIAPLASGLTTATLIGNVNPQGLASTAYFEYGTDTNYGSTTPAQTVGSGGDAVALSAAIAGLTPGTTYHYKFRRDHERPGPDGHDAGFAHYRGRRRGECVHVCNDRDGEHCSQRHGEPECVGHHRVL